VVHLVVQLEVQMHLPQQIKVLKIMDTVTSEQLDRE
jgi:hypothetical protein